jgi:hypothetical protein
MKKLFSLVFLLLMIAGCSSTKTPNWFIAGNQYVERYKENYLTQGETPVTELNFSNALEEVKKSGDLDLLEKIWLTRMALQCAALKTLDEGDYGKIAAVKPIPSNRNFYVLLTGDITETDDAYLPEQYRKFVKALRKGNAGEVGKTIIAMENSYLSKLIAAGIALRHNLVSDGILQTAVDTCSVNGWKATLLVWLDRMAVFYEASGNADKAAAVRKRIELIEK